MNNPFEVAIRFLATLTKQPQPKNMCCTLHYSYREADKDGFLSALRVLEAAGEMDGSSSRLFWAICQKAGNVAWPELDSFLAALPDKEPKKIKNIDGTESGAWTDGKEG